MAVANINDKNLELRTAVHAWLAEHRAVVAASENEENYVRPGSSYKLASALLDQVIHIRATNYDGLSAKASVLTALCGDCDKLALSICEDIKTLCED